MTIQQELTARDSALPMSVNSARAPLKSLSFLTYNVEGLSTILQQSVRCLILAYDFVLLTETFGVDFPFHLFPLYTVFVSPGIKLTDAPTGRLSGGVALLVRKQFARFVKQIHVEYDYCAVLQLSEELSGLDKDCILLGVYSPPSNSIYYKDCETDNGLSG